MEPFFSIIIPTYNRAGLISKAIDSVLSQSFNNWELIVVDDGSTDSTAEVVMKYTDERIRYIYQKNAERCAARNNGIDNAKGTYICFLDSDDYFLPDRLEGIYTELQKRDFPIAAFFTDNMADRNGILTKRFNQTSFDSARVLDSIAQVVIGCPQTCIHRTILQQYKYDVAFNIGEDMELWLRIASKYEFIYLADQPTFVAVEHDERSVNIERNNSYAQQMRMLRHIFSQGHPGSKISPEVKARLISHSYYGMAKYYIHAGKRAAAIEKMLSSLIAEPSGPYFKFKLNVFVKLITFAPFNSIKALIMV